MNVIKKFKAIKDNSLNWYLCS